MTKVGTISRFEFSHKSREATKSCDGENRNSGSRKAQFPNGMKDTRMGNIFEDSNLLKFSSREHSWLGLGFYVDGLLSQVNYTF